MCTSFLWRTSWTQCLPSKWSSAAASVLLQTRSMHVASFIYQHRNHSISISPFSVHLIVQFNQRNHLNILMIHYFSLQLAGASPELINRLIPVHARWQAGLNSLHPVWAHKSRMWRNMGGDLRSRAREKLDRKGPPGLIPWTQQNSFPSQPCKTSAQPGDGLSAWARNWWHWLAFSVQAFAVSPV